MYNLEIATFRELVTSTIHYEVSSQKSSSLLVAKKDFVVTAHNSFLFYSCCEKGGYFSLSFLFLNAGKGSASSLMCYKLLKGRQHFNPLPPLHICGGRRKAAKVLRRHVLSTSVEIR